MPARSDDDLLTIGQDLSKIQLTRRCGAPQPSGRLDRILHSGTLRQAHQTGSAHRAQHCTTMRGRADELAGAVAGEAFGGWVETDTGGPCGVANATGRARRTANTANTRPTSTSVHTTPTCSRLKRDEPRG